MSDEVENTEPGASETQPETKTTQKQSKPAGQVHSESKADNVTYLEEKIESLTKALNSEREAGKKLKSERDDLAGKVSASELKEKKATAFDTALAGLGEDFELPADRVPKVKDFLAKLPDSETLADEVAGFLDLVKMPKQKPEPLRNPFNNPRDQAATTGFKAGQKLTPHQVGQLSKEEFDQYIRSGRIV